MLSHFYRWLKKEVPARKLPAYVLVGMLSSLTIGILSTATLGILHVQLPNLLSDSAVFAWYFPLILVLNSFAEELLFRGPLYYSKLQSSPSRLLGAMLVLSALFGIYHGTLYNIAVQGVGGMIFCIMFLKCGGLQRKFWRGIGTSSAAHALFDCTLWAVYVSLTAR